MFKYNAYLTASKLVFISRPAYYLFIFYSSSKRSYTHIFFLGMLFFTEYLYIAFLLFNLCTICSTCACNNRLHAKPRISVFIHFVIFVITHVIINYFCCFAFIIYTCFSLLYFFISTFESVPTKYSCWFLSCIRPEHLALSVLLPYKYPSDCGIYCSHIYMTCFIFDNG